MLSSFWTAVVWVVVELVVDGDAILADDGGGVWVTVDMVVAVWDAAWAGIALALFAFVFATRAARLMLPKTKAVKLLH